MPASVGTSLLNTVDPTSRPASSTYGISGAPLPGEQIHLFWMSFTFNATLLWAIPTSVTDTKGGVWSAASPLPVVGQASGYNVTLPGPVYNAYACGDFVRVSGAALTVFDAITVHWGGNRPDVNSANVQGFLGVDLIAVKQNQGDYHTTVSVLPADVFYDYTNSDPDAGGTGVLSPLYRVDYAGLGRNPAPADRAAYLALTVSWDETPFHPEELGTVITSTNFAAHLQSLTLSVVFDPLVDAAVCREPGGTFTVLVADPTTIASINYQYVQISPVYDGPCFAIRFKAHK